MNMDKSKKVKLKWTPLHRGGGMITNNVKCGPVTYQFIISKRRSDQRYYLRMQYWDSRDKALRLRARNFAVPPTSFNPESVKTRAQDFIQRFLETGNEVENKKPDIMTKEQVFKEIDRTLRGSNHALIAKIWSQIKYESRLEFDYDGSDEFRVEK